MSIESKWAREALNYHLKGGDKPEAPRELKTQKAACFVSLHKSDGSLRGCIGSLEPMRASLADEIYENARSAALRDPRFFPVEAEELDRLSISVDVLSEAEQISDASALDPKVYGVIVQKGPLRGVLLPDLEGVDTIEQQVDIAKQKAGIPRHVEAKLFRFTVNRYEEA